VAEYSLLDESMRCPTCRATQAWADTCRRCKCDLRFLRETADAYVAARRQCLLALHARQWEEAVEWADRCVEIQPDDVSHQLLATCLFARGDWDAACSVAELCDEA